MTEQRVLAAQTGVNLSDIRPLTAPWSRRWGRMLPPLSPEALQYCAELAAVTYTLEFKPWLQAGWREISLEIDGTLTQGIGEEEGARGLESLRQTMSDVRLRIFQARINPHDRVEQVVGSIHQRKAIDSAKTLVMIHPIPGAAAGEAKYLVAVSFMGTTPRLYDWLGNFRMANKDGFHQGFLQVCRSFEAQAEAITFPRTAEELGLEKLTFGDICRACAGDTAHSPFRLLLVGHSQGGAVAQIWAWEQLRKGLHPRAMAGYCFASPSVMTAAAVQRAETVPLYHVLNSDDLVPKMGSALRLGIDLTYAADEGLRRACYNWPRDEQHVAHRVIIRPLMGLIRDTSSCMEVGCGLLLSLEGRDPADALPALRALRPDWPLLTRINESASDPMDRLLHFILRRAMSAHESIMGRPLNMERTAEISQLFRKVEDAIGIQAMMTAMVDLAIQPHTVLPREGCACSAYPYITLQGLEALQPAVWLGGEEATRLVINRREEGTPARSREAYHRKHREVRHG